MSEETTAPATKPPLDIVKVVEDFIQRITRESTPESPAARMVDQGMKVAWLNLAMLRLKEAQSELKGRLESEVGELNNMRRESDSGQLPLPFNEVKKTWRDVPVVELEAYGTTPGITKALVEANVGTLGHVADMDFQSQKVKGIGPENQSKLADACVKWHEAHPETPTKDAVDAYAWRKVPSVVLLDMGLLQRVMDTLSANECLSMGDVSDVCDHKPDWLSDEEHVNVVAAYNRWHIAQRESENQ